MHRVSNITFMPYQIYTGEGVARWAGGPAVREEGSRLGSRADLPPPAPPSYPLTWQLAVLPSPCPPTLLTWQLALIPFPHAMCECDPLL